MYHYLAACLQYNSSQDILVKIEISIFNKQFSAVDQELICGEWTSKLNGFLKYIRLFPNSIFVWMSESRGLHQSLPQSAQFISRLYPECIYLPQNILRPNSTMKTYKNRMWAGEDWSGELFALIQREGCESRVCME